MPTCHYLYDPSSNMSSSLSISKQQQKQQRQVNNNNNNQLQSRYMNAYFDRDEYHPRLSVHKNKYWNHQYHGNYNDFYVNDYHQYQLVGPSSSRHIRRGRQIKNEWRHNSKSVFSSSSLSNNNHSYYDNIPPRRRPQRQIDNREQSSSCLKQSTIKKKSDDAKLANISSKDEQRTKPLQSASSSSTNSNVSNKTVSTHPKDLHTKNLAAAAIAARQQNPQPQINLGIVQTLMNSLILQQQHQPSQSQSTVQLQYQLTNALLTIMIQQRLKETTLQAQAQQIQAAIPVLLAAQALVYQQQQQGQLTGIEQQPQAILPPNIAHPGTKFNNRPLVKFPVVHPTISPLSPPTVTPIVRTSVTTNLSRHRLGTNVQRECSTTALPTYQQVQEIEKGISLDEAIHLKNAIDIADVNNTSKNTETETIIDNNTFE